MNFCTYTCQYIKYFIIILLKITAFGLGKRKLNNDISYYMVSNKIVNILKINSNTLAITFNSSVIDIKNK